MAKSVADNAPRFSVEMVMMMRKMLNKMMLTHKFFTKPNVGLHFL